jgi:hypothetical protein
LCRPALARLTSLLPLYAREEQELKAGAILLAVLEEGKAGGAHPKEGDLVSDVVQALFRLRLLVQTKSNKNLKLTPLTPLTGVCAHVH